MGGNDQEIKTETWTASSLLYGGSRLIVKRGMRRLKPSPRSDGPQSRLLLEAGNPIIKGIADGKRFVAAATCAHHLPEDSLATASGRLPGEAMQARAPDASSSSLEP